MRGYKAREFGGDKYFSINLEDMNYSAGLGLRPGYAKVSGALAVRLDIGFPHAGRGGYCFSFGIDQQF